jgi:anhydro-N-acetylmuramic acid kinase
MKKTSYNVIGVMSGTSLDGLDLAYCTFRKDGRKWNYSIKAATTYNYSPEYKKKLSLLMKASAEELAYEDYAFGKYIGEKILTFMKKTGLRKPDFISSHGHTIFHQPHKGFTLQIGSGAAIHGITGIPAVSDFRSLDLCLGGQGAPLVPVGDKLLFQDFDFCLNLGGISNISFDYRGRRIAYDICPVNIILNELASSKGLSFDKDGKIGKKGNVNTSLLSMLNDLEYYSSKFPKSIGREWIDEKIFSLLKGYNITIEDKLATFYEHISFQILEELKRNLPLKRKGKSSLLCTGGGALNKFLINQIEKKLKGVATVYVPEKKIVLFKEALIFAFLGVLRVRNEVNSLSSVTGAKRDNMGGALYGNLIR